MLRNLELLLDHVQQTRLEEQWPVRGIRRKASHPGHFPYIDDGHTLAKDSDCRRILKSEKATCR